MGWDGIWLFYMLEMIIFTCILIDIIFIRITVSEYDKIIADNIMLYRQNYIKEKERDGYENERY